MREGLVWLSGLNNIEDDLFFFKLKFQFLLKCKTSKGHIFKTKIIHAKIGK